jgi:hypothetical protein
MTSSKRLRKSNEGRVENSGRIRTNYLEPSYRFSMIVLVENKLEINYLC